MQTRFKKMRWMHRRVRAGARQPHSSGRVTCLLRGSHELTTLEFRPFFISYQSILFSSYVEPRSAHAGLSLLHYCLWRVLVFGPGVRLTPVVSLTLAHGGMQKRSDA